MRLSKRGPVIVWAKGMEQLNPPFVSNGNPLHALLVQRCAVSVAGHGKRLCDSEHPDVSRMGFWDPSAFSPTHLPATSACAHLPTALRRRHGDSRSNLNRGRLGRLHLSAASTARGALAERSHAPIHLRRIRRCCGRQRGHRIGPARHEAIGTRFVRFDSPSECHRYLRQVPR